MDFTKKSEYERLLLSATETDMFIPQAIIDGAVDAIIASRDFCGNEREAVREFAIENGFKADWQKIHQIANFRANARWNGFKKAAGVDHKYCF